MQIADPQYWAKHHEPLHIALLHVVRYFWANSPPINDLQLQFTAHYAGKHCLESVVISRLANEGGAHAVAVGLLRNAVESLTVVAVSICNHPEKIAILQKWNDDKISQGQLRQALEKDIWPSAPLKGLWNQTWIEFWASLARAVQPYAHFSPPIMRWHQHAEMRGGRFYFWVNHPQGDYEQYRADRIATFQLLILWAFAEIICAFEAAPKIELQTLSTLADSARIKLESAPVFFSGEKWDVQLIPFIFPKEDG